ncbi:hypothetical protein [Chitinophaga nivalis]|uniref:Uncharacterized protein n=1 Tax=Chitinophaga nivalis TaxID=2991709 RepID=A0ABT3IIK2_9BACT|nr:hypothetical protein [Chitinophaga nivalis]MCW3466518.1 hypothetical protein [Chitinophaga nivalis]MCW3483791.1 hypothetical protein [Chitinophaga nivalis]
MTTALSLKERKREKGKIRRRMKKLVVKVKDVADSLAGIYHEQTVFRAMDIDNKYWNQTVIDKAQELITLKKNK